MSKNKPGRNPFRPGPATKPAYLAGRGRELQVIADTLEDINQPLDDKTRRLKEAPRAPIKIVGPRGSGKTTLLNEAREMAESKEITVVEATELQDLEPDSTLYAALVGSLKEEGQQAEIKGLLARIKDLKLGPVGMSLSAKEHKLLFQEVLGSCLMQGPMLLRLDEAMEYDAKALGSLLRICQQMIGMRYPLALLLAGTPNLNRKLGQTGASFIDRTEDINIDMLSPEATREGLREPFKGSAILQDEALELMAKMTDDYPYFTQVVGSCVWDAMAASGRAEVDKEIVSRAEEIIGKKRDEFYQKIYERLDELSLLEHASQTMDLLRLNGGRAARGTVMKKLALGFNENSYKQAKDAFHNLVDRGFIWENKGKMEAGIPSFFTFFENKQQGEVGEKL